VGQHSNEITLFERYLPETLATAKAKAAQMFAQEMRKPVETENAETLKGIISQLQETVATLTASLAASGQRMPPARPKNRCKIDDAANEFNAHMEKNKSFHHADSTRGRVLRFVAYSKEKHNIAWIDEPTPSMCAKWLDSCNVSKKTKQNYHGDVSGFFNWCIVTPREWRTENPFDKVQTERVKNTSVPQGITADQAAVFLKGIEVDFPEFALFYYLSLIGGVRADKRDSELTRLADDIAKSANGIHDFFFEGKLTVTKPKVGAPRQIPLPPAAMQWIRRYPTLKVPMQWQHSAVIKQYGLPYNALRHTGLTAYVKICGSLAEAAEAYGTSEAMVKRHYLIRMSKQEARAIRAIRPSQRKKVPPAKSIPVDASLDEIGPPDLRSSEQGFAATEGPIHVCAPAA
jgi:site-specific recombinase XerD